MPQVYVIFRLQLYVAGSTNNHRLQRKNQPRCGHQHLACRPSYTPTSPALRTTQCHLQRTATKDCGLSFSVADVSKTFKHVNPLKAAGPDGIPSYVIRAYADQLAGVFKDIFNLSLSQSVVPSCFKMSTIVPVPKKAKATELNVYRPVALTSVIIKCFDRIISRIKGSYQLYLN